MGCLYVELLVTIFLSGLGTLRHVLHSIPQCRPQLRNGSHSIWVSISKCVPIDKDYVFVL